MKIACYCQHVLGIGHFHRSLEICKALAARHETVMILGGPDVTLPESAVRFLQLPGLKMDADFSKLLPCKEGADLEQVKQERKEQLLDFFSSFQPDIFLIELYPFGRKAFRFELDPILGGIGSGELAPCLRLCSLRDILVEKKNNSEMILWAIQDFQILLPKSFKLSGHNFGAGLTRLSFIDSGLTMHLCRLAGASQRLQKSSMLTLMNLLGDLNISEEDAQHLELSVSHCSYPSILQQIRSRIKRKPPFHWVILRHHPEHDRLSGLFFFDKKPIPDKMISTILDSYEIFSL